MHPWLSGRPGPKNNGTYYAFRAGRHSGAKARTSLRRSENKARRACGQSGSPAKNVEPVTMTPTAVSTLLLPSALQYISFAAIPAKSLRRLGGVAHTGHITPVGCG
jgi:hypothetical protein